MSGSRRTERDLEARAEAEAEAKAEAAIDALPDALRAWRKAEAARGEAIMAEEDCRREVVRLAHAAGVRGLSL